MSAKATSETEVPRIEAEISHSVGSGLLSTFDRMGGEAMSVKAERPLKDAIEARRAKMSSKTSSKSRAAWSAGRRSKNPAASAVDNERPLERHEPNKATIYRVTSQVILLRTKRRSARAHRGRVPRRSLRRSWAASPLRRFTPAAGC